jgi:RND family efflux transporter MFP subunit
MKNINKVVFVLVALLGMSACSNDKKVIENNEAAIVVKTSTSANNNSGKSIAASGKIEAENSANISTRMMGYVTKLNVKVGQKVSAGQQLVTINNTDLQAKKAQVEAAIQQATAGYNNAKKDYERFVALFNQQSASQKELDDMTTRYEMAKAGLEAAKQMRNEVMAQFNYTSISAPFAGVITNTFIKEGDMANPGMPLVSLEGEAHLQVTAMVSETDITNIENGMSVSVLVKSINQTVLGKVVEVSASAKNTGGQYLVKIGLVNPSNKVLSGMFVNVLFKTTTKTESNELLNKILVPLSALVKQGQLTGIYTIGNDGIAILRWVRTGKIYDNQVEILSGLAANEEYIISSEGKLYNGAKVSVK